MRALLFLWLCAACAPFAGAQAKYKVVDLYPDIHVSGLVANSVNNRGEVLLTDQSSVSFLWRSPGSLETIKYQNESTRATGLNNQGQAVGTTGVNGLARTFVYSSLRGIEILEPSPGYPQNNGNAINDKGEVVATGNIGGARHPLMWRPGTGWEDLSGPPPLDKVGPAALNESGQFAGAYRAADLQVHAVLYTPGIGIKDLGMPEGMNSWQAEKINNLGVIGGSMNRLADSASVAFLRDADGTLTQLLDPAQHINYSYLEGLNDEGTAVGSMDRPGQFGGQGGFIYHKSYGIRDLDELKDEESSAYRIRQCHGISQNGMLVATATLEGVYREVLLVPVVPEPPVWATIAVLAPIVVRRRRPRF